MSQLKLAALICHGLAIVPMLIGGLVYATRESYLSYHATATAYTWEELTPGMQTLLQAMLNGAGGLMVLVSTVLLILLCIPFKNNDRWSFWAIPLIGISAILITIRAAFYVAINTPSNPPWQWLLILICLFISGWLLSYKSN